MIYLDSSALLKILFLEAESATLQEWLATQDDALVTGDLARVEVLRACRRLDPEALPAARALLGQLDRVPLAAEVLELAAAVGTPMLRSLDALHLASALSLGVPDLVLVGYDCRLLEAADAAGLGTRRPGA